MSKYSLDAEEVPYNKLGITDQAELQAAEAAICHVRMLELSISPVEGEFDFVHLREIHRRLLSDIYFFAGELR